MNIEQESSLLGDVHPAVIAIWAALIAIGNLLPTIPLIGVGGTFSVSAAFTPLAGIFFGPLGGAVSAAAGGFIGQLLAPHTAWLGIATFIVGTVNALVTGLVSRRKWIYGVLIILLGTVFWFTTSIGREAAIFPAVFYTLGVIMAVLGGKLGIKLLKSPQTFKKGVGIWLISFAGFVGAAAIANYFSIVVLHMPAEAWLGLTFLAPLERAIFSLGAAVIGAPLLAGLPKIGVYVGPGEIENQEDNYAD